MEPVFLDAQGFIGNGNKFIVKEIAVLKTELKTTLEENEIHHLIFKESYPWTQLTSDNKRKAYWLTNNNHGFSLDSSDVVSYNKNEIQDYC